jgi:pilus assembly protein CpaE
VSRPIRAILAVDDGIDADNLVALFGGDESLRLAQVVTRFEDASRILGETQADVLVIAAMGYSERALSLLDRAVKADAERPVLVLSQGSPNGFVRRVFEAGGEDILVMPQSPEQFQFAVQKAIARRRSGASAQSGDQGRIISVLGPKGGTGKTLTSSNLTVALAQAGQRTVIVDLDLQFGDVGLCMGLSPDRTMYDLALAGGTIDLDKLEAYLSPHPTGAYALLAPNRPDQAGAITVQMLQDVYSALRSQFDFIIVDTPPGFTSEVIATIDASSDLVMVGMLDSLSLKNTKLGLETLDLMGYDRANIRLVLNRAHSRVGISQSDVVAVLGREPDILVPSDREIPRAVNEGVPIVLARPDSESAAAFRTLSEMYTGMPSAALTLPAPEKRSSLFSRRAGKKV